MGGSRSGAASAGAACPAGAMCSRPPRSCGLRLASAKGLGPSSDMLPALLRLLRLPGLTGSSKHASSSAPPLPAARLRLPPAGGPRWGPNQGSTAGACSSSGAQRSLPPPPRTGPLLPPLLCVLCSVPRMSRAWLRCRHCWRGARCISSASRSCSLQEGVEGGWTVGAVKQRAAGADKDVQRSGLLRGGRLGLGGQQGRAQELQGVHLACRLLSEHQWGARG